MGKVLRILLPVSWLRRAELFLREIENVSVSYVPISLRTGSLYAVKLLLSVTNRGYFEKHRIGVVT